MEKGAGHGVRGQRRSISRRAPSAAEWTKRTFTEGLQNVSPHSEMPDVLSGLFRHHTLLNLSDYPRLCAGAQPVPNSTISLHPPIPPTPVEERSGRKVAQAFFAGKKLPSSEYVTKPHRQE